MKREVWRVLHEEVMLQPFCLAAGVLVLRSFILFAKINNVIVLEIYVSEEKRSGV